MENNTQQETPNDFERDAILNIQRYLRHLSFHDAGIPTTPIDGIWERETRESLMSFQQSRGLPVTGTVDRRTWDVLKEEYDRSIALNSPPVPLFVFPRSPVGYALSLGDKNYLSVMVQHILDELERIYLFKTLSDSGVYDETTAENIREFQARNMIPESGEVDRETWDALAAQYNILSRYSE